MNNRLNKLAPLLRRNLWFLAAFFIPLAVRCIPEILSWPYPLGLDTLNTMALIESGASLTSGPLFVIQRHLFYPIETLAYWLVGDINIVIKVFGLCFWLRFL